MVIIHPERVGDEAAIRAVLLDAFPTDVEARLVAALRAAGRLTVSLVADRAGCVIGHVAFSPVTVTGCAGGVGLAPLSVLSEARRQGIGVRLVREGLAACARQGATFVVVLGEPDYYRRFGFLRASDWGLTDDYGGGDAFHALELVAGAIPKLPVRVHYAPEFAAFA